VLSLPREKFIQCVGAWACVGLFIVLYGNDCGRGFISDDFAWIQHGRLEGAESIYRIFSSAQGFYRPMVSLSFGLNYYLFGDDPRPYGLTNLAAAVVCALLVAALGRRIGLSASASTWAAVVWLFNFHGINMSILWISGRTSLFLTAFSLLAALAFVRRRYVQTGIFAFAAMLSKEEAVMLPPLLTAWGVIEGARSGMDVSASLLSGARRLLMTWCALLAYLALRTRAAAISLGSAPDFYTPVFDVERISRNIIEYADRAGSLATVSLLCALALARRLPVMSRQQKTLVVMSAAWVVAGFALTTFLPVRSSLYAVFPSVGVAVIAACLMDALAARDPGRFWPRATLIATAVLLCLLPVYHSRNMRWVELGELSTSVISQLRRYDAAMQLTGARVAIVDDEDTRANLRNAWAGLVPEVAQVMFDGRFRLDVLRPGEPMEAGHEMRRRFRLQHGHLRLE
jgi:hypothetical protein